jgi:DNA-binding NarL/FixJ family response regulator
LTPQERSVAQMAASGRSNREIAAELLISVKSVERYLTQVYRKLGVESRAGLPSDERR